MKMKRKLLSLLLALCLVLMIVPVSTFAAEEPSFGGGTGTQEAPWLITSQGDLIALAEFLNSGKAEEFDAGNNGIGNCHGYYFKQTADIDLTGVAWEPIGYSGSYYFAGNYDGDGHSIKNAISTGKVDPDGFATAGIFGWVAFGSVKNLHVKNANFVATGQNNYSYVGGIAGVCYGSSIINCSVVNSFLESKRNSNNNCAGSIVGYSTGGTFEKCAAENNQVKTMAYGGGFVGEVDDDPDYGAGASTFTNCYTANCSVSSKTDDVQGVSLVGGFVGEMTDSALTVQNCYVYRATLSTEGTAVPAIKATGVFAGQLWGGSSINNTNCFFGACGTTENVGTASEKTEEEFKNGTVAELLGEAFAQVGDYPKINGPADYSSVDAAIAKANALNKNDYKDFSAVETAVNAVTRGKNLKEQGEVDAMAKAIEDAVAALQYKDADYTKVDAAIDRANKLNKDNYKDFTGVEAAVNAVAHGKNITQQAEVDAMAKAIEDALAALQYKDADYTKVDAAIAKANALNKNDYKDFSGVEAAVKAVVRGKNVTEQSEVDKMAKAIEKAIDALQYKGADYTKVDAAIAKANALNKDNYKDFSGVEAAVKAVVRGKNITEQSEVNAMAKAIEDAIKALVCKDADYTKVDEAIAKANALNKDNYKDFSGVEAAVKAVVRGKNITEQSEVDKMAKAIEKAIDALQYKGADYTKVDAAIAKTKALNKNNYKDFSGVDDAVKAVVRGKNVTKQSEVDAMAKAIEDAINALVYKDADYTKVDAAIAKAKALNKDNYKDFTGVDDAVKAVVRGKNITEQSEVDKMAKVIEKAIDALQYKGADYTKVDAAIGKAKALNKDNYKDFSGVESAVKAVVRGKNITKQSEVDKMAKAIEKAIDALQYKGADYTKVDAAIEKANALNKKDYKDFSGVESAVKAVVRGKNITKQSEVDKMEKAIEDAIAALQYKGANYTKVDAAIGKANALNKDNYKDFSGVEAAVKAVVRGKNVTKQSEVDAMAKAIEDAINALVYKDADYTKVDAAIAKANALNKDNYKDFSGVEAAVKAVVRGKNITEQSEVDKMAKAIEKAIDALQYKGADYTKVDAAIGKANALNKDNYKDFSGVEAVVKAVVRGKNITEQSEVDKMAKAIDDAISVLQYKDADYTKVDAVIAKAPEPSKDFGDSNNTSTNGGRVTGTSDSSKNTDSRNNSDTETKPYIKDDKGKEGWDVISSQLDDAKSGETVTVVMNGTTVVPKDIFDSIKGEDVTLVLDMGNGLSWKINGKDITDAAGDIDFGVTVGADAGKSIPVDVINNVTGERYSMNLSLAYDGEFGFTARLTINMESKNTGLYANLFYYNEQTGKLEFVSAGLIDADGNVELEFTHASDYTIVIDAAVMDGGNKDSINTTKDNENAEDNTTIPASNADNAKSDAWNPAIIIIIGICILLIVVGVVIFVRKKSGSEEE